MNTIYTCDIKINPVSVEEVSDLTEQWLNDGKKGFQITGVNVEQIAYLRKFPEFKEYINSSDVVNIDGVSVCWYLKLKGFKLSGRALCADIFQQLLQNARSEERRVGKECSG